MATLVYAWATNGGDVSFGRLEKIPVPEHFSLVHLLPPLALIGLTRWGAPVSTTFLLLTVFAPKGLESMLTKSLAVEYATRKVRVNCICPGQVDTNLLADFTFPEGADQRLLDKLLPLVRGAAPEEIAALIAYLASDEARYVTGAAWPIDGGQTAG